MLAGDSYGQAYPLCGRSGAAGVRAANVVSGPPVFTTSTSATRRSSSRPRQGYPAEWFLPLPNSALSTREEAVVVLDELQRRDVGSFLLVTSDYHTARAARIYRATMRKRGGGPDMRVVAAPDRWFHADGWWKSRKG